MPTGNNNSTTLYIMAGDKMIEMPGIESVEVECDMPEHSPLNITTHFEVSFTRTDGMDSRSFLRHVMPNNWLKRHGYPMRRKSKKG